MSAAGRAGGPIGFRLTVALRDVTAINGEDATVRFSTAPETVRCRSRGTVCERKTSTSPEKLTRLSFAEQLLHAAVCSDDACIHFTGQVDQSYYETFPDDLFGKAGSGDYWSATSGGLNPGPAQSE